MTESHCDPAVCPYRAVGTGPPEGWVVKSVVMLVVVSFLPGVLRALGVHDLGVHDLTWRQSRCGRGAVVSHVLDRETAAVSLPRVPRGPKARSSGWNVRLGVCNTHPEP